METLCAYCNREAEYLIKVNFSPEMVANFLSETIPLFRSNDNVIILGNYKRGKYCLLKVICCYHE